ncbi:response regulator [Candidatus Saccharibacteria bacterium]|nr:response regulator [Candidatus Saccharibacteria bacterium]
MTKIMLVEDDKSLREIYGVRLLAEGYEITSAGDGEEALAMAVKEKPDLILSDVMMPKISGFDMLDILRATPETKNIRVIMMTALSSEDQRARGESLGANRYLVKSQVGIEDVVRAIHDVLADTSTPAPAPSVQKFGTPAPDANTITKAPITDARPVTEPPTRSAQANQHVDINSNDKKPLTPITIKEESTMTPDVTPVNPIADTTSAPTADPTAPTAPVAPAPVETVVEQPTQAPTAFSTPVEPTPMPEPTAPFSSPAPTPVIPVESVPSEATMTTQAAPQPATPDVVTPAGSEVDTNPVFPPASDTTPPAPTGL